MRLFMKMYADLKPRAGMFVKPEDEKHLQKALLIAIILKSFI